MRLKDIQYFIALTEEKSFTKAAEKYHVSQPTISYAIKHLENDLKAQLIIRDQSHKRMALTQNGKIFYKHAESALSELGKAQEEISSINGAVIHAGIPNTIASYYTAAIIPALEKAGISGNVALTEGSSHDLLNALGNGDIELAAIFSLEPVTAPYLKSETILHIPFEITVSPQHPLADRSSVRFEELANEKFILLSPKSSHYTAFRLISRKTGTYPSILYQNKNINIVNSMVENNAGIGFLADIDPLKDKGRLHHLKLENTSVPPLLLSVVQPRQKQLSTIHTLFTDIFKEIIKGSLPAAC